MQVTIDPVVVTHTIKPHSCGVNFAPFFYFDLDSQFYRNLCVAAGFELFRIPTTSAPTTYQFYTTAREFAKYMQLQLGSAFAVILGTPTMPTPQPSGPATLITASVSTSAGRGVADHVALYENWINYGIDIRYWHAANEPTLNSFDQEGDGLGGGTPWFGDGLGSAANQRKCEDWDTIHHREVKAAYDVKIAALGKTGITRHECMEIGNITAQNGYDIAKRFLDGTMGSGGTNPNSPVSNISFIDTIGAHSYVGSPSPGGPQAQLNGLFWDAATSEANYEASGNKGYYVAPMRWLRTRMDAAGGTNIGIGFNEGGGYNDYTDPHLALWDIAQSVAFCRHAGEFNLTYNAVHMASRSDGQEGLFLMDGSSPDPPTSEASCNPGRRYYAFRDMWGRYQRLYKSQVSDTINTPAGNTPATVTDNAVPRLQVVAGKNTAGTILAIMVVSLDLVSAEQLTISWGSPANGNITGFRCPLGQGASALPTITPFGNGFVSFTTGTGGAPTFAAGDSFLFEIPLSGAAAPPGGHLSGTRLTGTRITGVRI